MRHYSVAGLLGLIVIACAPPASRAEDGTADAVLKNNALKRSGTTYILASEAQLQKLLTTARDQFKRYTLAQRQQQMFEQGTKNSKELIRDLTQQRLMLNRQLAMTTTANEHNRMVMMMNDLTDQLNLLRDEADNPDAKKEIIAIVTEHRGVFMQAVLDARNLVDETTAKYADLSRSDEVKNALASLNAKTKAKLTLGPSRSFQENVKLLDKVEKSILTEAVSLREDNGVFFVDVTLNGKVTKAMYLDTGASMVSISAKVAEELGLKPDRTTPTARSHIADGSTVEVKLMTIPSVRVGKFTINRVQCAVSLPEQGDTPLLLGGSFLKNFVYHIKPDSATLILTRIETGDEPRPGPKSKTADEVPAAKSTHPSRDAPSVVRGAVPPTASVGEVRRFEGHTEKLFCVTFAPDGHHAASGGWDKIIRLWDVDTGEEVRRFEGHEGAVHCLAFTPDGRRIASGGGPHDRTIRIWLADAGWELHKLEGHQGAVKAVVYSPDGRRLISAGEDGSIRLWDANTGRELRRFEGHTGPVVGVAFSPDGRSIVSAGGQDRTARLWDVETGKEVRRFEGHAGGLGNVAFASDGRRFATAGGAEDRTVRLWDVETGKEIRRLDVNSDASHAMALSRDGRSVLVSESNVVGLWNVASGERVLRFEGHRGQVTGVAFSPDGRLAISCGEDKTVRLWALPGE